MHTYTYLHSIIYTYINKSILFKHVQQLCGLGFRMALQLDKKATQSFPKPTKGTDLRHVFAFIMFCEDLFDYVQCYYY